MLITIDGTSGNGKSTAGRLLAERVGADFFSTGRLIRYLASRYAQLEAQGRSPESIFDRLYTSVSLETIARLKDGPKDPVLYNDALTPYFGKITANESMLQIVDRELAEFCREKDVVFDGRNLFAIFPQADFRFYLESSREARVDILAESDGLSREEASRKISDRDGQERRFKVPYSELHVIDPFAQSLDQLLDLMYTIVMGAQAADNRSQP